ncbi:HAMP domain-containing protein [Novispirillum sp. DQ9]|uniref:HAMP domain-containing protein n=1 Tax=Novispirillum sp. DQ9 TaxID=3398612 RepID=UPI003C7E9589
MPLKRLIIAAALLVALAAGLVAALALGRVEEAVRPDVSAKLEGVGRTIAGQIGLALDYGIPFSAIPRMEEFLAAMTREVPEIARVRVTDAGGATLYALGPQTDGPAVTLPVSHKGAPAGAVILGIAPGDDAAGTGALFGRLGALVAAGAVAGGALLAAAGWWWGARPLGRLRGGLDRLAGGTVDIEFPENAPAEIGALARAAERLRAAVERRHDDFAVEMEEIALAQPDAGRRQAVEALVAEAR